VNAVVCHTAEFSPVLLYSNRRLGYKTKATATQLLHSNSGLGYKNNSSSNTEQQNPIFRGI